MTISPELAMLNTNVLIYAYYEDAPQYPAAFPLLDRAQEAGASLCLSPQVLTEFYGVNTNPRRVSAPFTIDEALAEIGKLRALPGLTLLRVPLDVVDRWVALLREHPVAGRQVFDAQLVATMLGNSVIRLYTFNRTDFEHFPGIEVLNPTAP
jgi:toxin-antitoxin system PIN domain toxin